MDIIATVGPKTNDKWILKEFIKNGVTILRLNCSHFNKEQFEKVIREAREISNDIHIMVDLCGKKIRVSEDLKYIYKIYSGEEIYFCAEDFYNSVDILELKDMRLIPLTISVDKLINNNITSISMKDNTMNFEIIEKKQGIIKAKVIKGGIIRAGKGCNLPNIKQNKEKLTEKDKSDILWGIDNKVDIICQSFVENSMELKSVRDYIKKNTNGFTPKLWGKVETPKGIKALKEIIKEVDTIVIGRGDLVPESGILRAVELEEDAIRIIVENNKNVIIATHLLNSMKNGEQPTLPEVESIYNFISKGASGFLLAGESSIGKVPIKTVEFLANTIKYYRG